MRISTLKLIVAVSRSGSIYLTKWRSVQAQPCMQPCIPKCSPSVWNAYDRSNVGQALGLDYTKLWEIGCQIEGRSSLSSFSFPSMVHILIFVRPNPPCMVDTRQLLVKCQPPSSHKCESLHRSEGRQTRLYVRERQCAMICMSRYRIIHNGVRSTM